MTWPLLLAGAVLISALTTSFLTGVAYNPNVPQDVASKAHARIDGLRSSLALLAIIALIALFATRRIPAQQPTASPEREPTALTGEP